MIGEIKNNNDERHHLIFVSNGVGMEMEPVIKEPILTIGASPVESPEKGYYRLYYTTVY